MARVTYYRRGKIFGWYNDFEKAGDRIPRHSHTRDKQHSIIVLRGAIEVLGAVHEAGEVTHIEHDGEHSVLALEDGTRTLHLLLNGDGGFTAADGDTFEE